MPTSDTVRYLFKGLTPVLEERPAYERFATIVNTVLKRVGVHADTCVLVKEAESPFAIGNFSTATRALVEEHLGQEAAQLSPLPRVCFRTTQNIALGAAHHTDEQITKKLEGAILHEAWHVLSPHNSIASSIDSYHELLTELHRCGNMIGSRNAGKVNATIAQHFGSMETFMHRVEVVKKEIHAPFEQAFAKLKFMNHKTPAQLADEFAKKPFELLPQEEPLQNLPGVAAIEQHLGRFKKLAQTLAVHPEASEGQYNSLHPSLVRLKEMTARQHEWSAVSGTYTRAVEFSCDEFSKANAHYPNSLTEFFANDVRDVIREVAQVGSVTLSNEQLQTIEAALVEGKPLTKETEAGIRRVHDVTSSVLEQVAASDKQHPSYLDRIQRLRQQDAATSTYRKT